MAKKWSQHSAKSSLVTDDEFMILDSADANAATKNKRVKMSSVRNNINNRFEFQTVGATNQQQAFLFSGAIIAIVAIAAANAGNTKGYSAGVIVACTVTNTNAINVSPVASDFISAAVTVATTTNSITLTLTGEAGETINWRGHVYYVNV